MFTVTFFPDRFLSTPSGWRATFRHVTCRCRQCVFLSTPSGWRATGYRLKYILCCLISIHALRVEGDRIVTLVNIESIEISIHALRVEGDIFSRACTRVVKISIHALRVEGDA